MNEFEWDPRKAGSNLKKHGVSFAEALTVFSDPAARIFDDLDHSVDERREIIIGYSRRPRLLIVGFAERWPGSYHHRTAGVAGRDKTS
jgi:uncharacterized DUF497 family protein